MHPSRRVVTQLPLDELWDEQGTLAATRGVRLGPDEIAAFARRGPIRFVVADAGQPLQWVPLEGRFAFWKAAKAHVLPREAEGARLEDFGGYFYVATEWTAANSAPIVLLAMHH